MKQHECPTCGTVMEQDPQDRDECFCPFCGVRFVEMLNGQLFSLPPRQDIRPLPPTEYQPKAK